MAKYILTDNYDDTTLVFKSKDELINHLIYHMIGDMTFEVKK